MGLMFTIRDKSDALREIEETTLILKSASLICIHTRLNQHYAVQYVFLHLTKNKAIQAS